MTLDLPNMLIIITNASNKRNATRGYERQQEATTRAGVGGASCVAAQNTGESDIGVQVVAPVSSPQDSPVCV